MPTFQERPVDSAVQNSPPQPVSVWRRLDIWIGFGALILLGLLGLAIWSPARQPLEHFLISLLRLDANFLEGLIHPTTRDLQVALRRDELLAAALVVLSTLLYFKRRIAAPLLLSARAFDLAIWLACTVSVFVALMSYGHEGDFSPVTVLMQRPQEYPITGNRLLMVWLADALKWLAPSLSYLRCYFLSQLMATGAAMYLMGQWCVMFFGSRYRALGQVLLAAMLIPTIIYYTFYDIAMVFFYTLCLMLLYRKRYVLFAMALGVGTLNHENTLLLVLVAAAVLYGSAPLRTFLLVPAGSFLAWLAVRVAMQHFMPIHGHFEMHIWTNLLDLAGPSQGFLKSAGILVFWWWASSVGMRYADPFLRRAAALLPALIVVTFIVGKFIEARQWDAFLPVGIALLLSKVAAKVQRNGTVSFPAESA